MVKLDDLVSELLEEAKLNSSDGELRKECLTRVFKGMFEVRMAASMGINKYVLDKCVLDAEVAIRDVNKALDSLIARYSIQEKSAALGAAQKIYDYLLDNCTELVFTTTFTDPTPSNRKKVLYFHEFHNRGVNVRARWKKRADKLGGFSAGVLTTALGINQFVAEHPLINIGQQGVMWGYVGSLITSAIPSLVLRVYGNPRRIWLREREHLGKEKIVEAETLLDKKYLPIVLQEGMEKGVYAGQSDMYKIYNRGEPLKLREWVAVNKGNLFQATMLDTPLPPSLVWIVGVYAKIDRSIVKQEHCRAFWYTQVNRESADHIDSRYIKEVKVPGETLK